MDSYLMKHLSLGLLLGLTAGTTFAAEAEPDNADSKATSLEVINVYGRVPNDAVKDVPQSVSVFNRDLIEISPVDTVGDIIRFVPTATRNGSTLNAFGDDYLIRGFGASQTINGLGLNRIAHARDTANVERIEVLKGPAAVLYGQMEPGAVINVVTEQPLDVFQAELRAEAGSYDHQRYTVDVTGPLTTNARGRLNLAYQDSGSHIDFWSFERFFVAPNVTVDLSPATNVTLEGSYTTNDWSSFQNGTPAFGAFLPNPHGEYAESFNPDEPDIGFTRRDSADVNLRLNHALNDNVAFRASYTYTRNEADFKETFAFLGDDFRTVDRAVFVGEDTYENDHNLLLDFTGIIDAGRLTHKFIAGVSYREFDASRPTSAFFMTPIDLFEPAYGLATDVDVEFSDFLQDFTALEGFVQDRISVSDQLHLLLGLRYTDATQETEHVDPDGEAFPDGLDETNWTTQVGALYDITDGLSVYANRSESFVPQFGTSSGGRPFDAEESVQYELGSRYDLGATGLTANAAVFTIAKENLTTSDPDPENAGSEVALGEVESRGVELTVSGYLNSHWLISAGYGYVETEITRNFDGLEGNALRNTPKNTFSAQTRYDIASGPLAGLGLGGTVEYVDERFGNDDNSFELPSYTRVDLGAYYSVTDSLQVDLLLNNVLDEEIFLEGYTTARVIREPGRTFLARVTYELR
jgi:iron complex outermembrane receptor protein